MHAQLLRTSFVVSLMGLSVVASGCRGWTSDSPPVHLNPNMDTQHKLKPYRGTAAVEDRMFQFPDGRMMRMPVEGTVARTVSGKEPRDADLLAIDDHMYAGMQDGEPARGFPKGFVVNTATMERGKQRYEIFCAPCHAADGSGKGTVARRLPVPPPDFHTERIRGLPLGHIYDVITHGRNWPNMPAYNTQITPSDRWAVAAYMRALLRTKKPDLPLVPEEAAPPPPIPDDVDPAQALVMKGEQIFKQKICVTCHSIDGSRLIGPTFKGIYGRMSKATDGKEYLVDDAFIMESVREPMKLVADGYPPAMPAQQLTDDEFQALIAWIKTLK